MARSERDIMKKLRQDAEAAEALFSNAGRVLRERTAVAGLLRVLGLQFSEDQIAKGNPEPVDVTFHDERFKVDARFQVTEILDQGRPRDREIKQRSAHIKRATHLRDLVEEGDISSCPITPEELLTLVVKRCKKKARTYGGDCRSIDLILYVNLQQRHLYPPGPFPATAPPECIRWRSVSVIMELFAIVLWAANDAPAFLIEHRGKVVKWEKLSSVFPRLGD